MKLRNLRSLACLLCGLLALTSAYDAYAIEVPSPQGGMNVGHQVLSFTEEEGAVRDLEVDLWFPTPVEAADGNRATYGDSTSRYAAETNEILEEGPFPLIVYSHGAGGRPIENTTLMESLASHGFIIAATSHQGGFPVAPEDRFNRPPDIRSIIDVLYARTSTEADPLFGMIRTDGVGAVGFSLGGNTVKAAVAGTSEGEIEPDDRIKSNHVHCGLG